MSEQPRTPDSARRSERSRRAILDAALELVGEVGFGKLTIEAIAARAGVGKQTIYRWWPSKASVLFDSFLALSEDSGGPVLPDTGDLEADLKLVLRATADELADPKYDLPLRALTAESQHDPALARELNEKVLEPQLAAFEARLRSARDAGRISPRADLRVALEMLVGPLYHRWMLRTLPLTHAYADSVVETVLRGLAPGPESV
ncbi:MULTISPECIES: TetR/AcrR family transcriptional regulator [Streptomyces]|uniref:TetR/AcrR family transcriptional regulator n=1 Tax=Streptomyces lycii TaxID=2654337 RepID=A0ABQ7FCJ3_9ACTN|nr:MULTISPECIES: TetR/AcrR family transcriptional regulator [Streptomyces]KAF4406721.1 TetR/AcrR family transcriptional regulator [Streptomyces lycii]PGH50651.1 TetR family transcriptional regulator [Streptomyces sp. Ru87]